MKTLRLLLGTTPETKVLHQSAAGSSRGLLLFGWSGSRMGHLAKYQAMWSGWEPGCTVGIAAPLGVFSRPNEAAVEAAAASMVAALPPRGDVMLHVFSNGGLVYASRAWTLLGDRCKGVVFDSSPSLDTRPNTPATVVAEAVGFWKPVFHTLTVGVLTVGLWLMQLFGKRMDILKYFGVPLIRNLKCKKLFLCSSADAITNVNMLKEFVAGLDKAELFDFGDSPHVGVCFLLLFVLACGMPFPTWQSCYYLEMTMTLPQWQQIGLPNAPQPVRLVLGWRGGAPRVLGRDGP